MSIKSLLMNGEMSLDSRIVGLHISLDEIEEPKSWEVTIHIKESRIRPPEFLDDLPREATIQYRCVGSQPELRDAELILSHILELLSKE